MTDPLEPSELPEPTEPTAQLEPAGAASDAAAEELPAEFLQKLKANKRKRRIKMIAAGVVVVLAVGAGAGVVIANNAASNVEQETTGTYTQAVTQEDFELTVEGSGTLAASSTASVTPQVSGTVKTLKVEAGDTVKKGQTLMTLESDELSDALSNAATTLSDASESYSDAKSAYAKAKRAYAKAKKKAKKSSSDSSGGGTTSASAAVPGTSEASTSSTTSSTSSASTALTQAQSALTQAQSSMEQAKSTYKQAYTAYDEASEAMDDLTITAPVAGTVTEVALAVGDAVTSGSTAAMTIQNTKTMTLTMQVSEYDIGNIKVGQSASVTVTALEKTIDAEVTNVATTASSASGSSVNYDVELTIDSPTKKMLSGMSASAEIVYKSYENALIVPTSAISKASDGSQAVTVQASDGSTKQVAVEVLGGTDEESAVTGDLAAGDMIVVTYTIGSFDSSASSSSDLSSLMGGGAGGGNAAGGGFDASSAGGGMPSGGSGGGEMPSMPGGGAGGGMPGGSN